MVEEDRDSNTKNANESGSDAFSQPDQEKDEVDSQSDQVENESDETTNQSKPSLSERINARNLGRWTIEAILADRVVKVADGAYKRVKEILASTNTDNKEYVDLSKQTSFSGTKFKIIFFDGAHEMWFDILEENSPIPDILAGPPKNFDEILSQDGVPSITVESVSVDWDQYPYDSNIDSATIHTTQNKSELNVILPDHGKIYVTGEVDDHEGWMWAQYMGDGGPSEEEQMIADIYEKEKWTGAYLDPSSSEPYEWHIPVPRSAEVNGKNIS